MDDALGGRTGPCTHVDEWSPATVDSRVAVFGGSFNPPHVAHMLACALALSTSPIDEVVVVPVFRHPFSKELAPFEDRLAMCRLAMGWLPSVRISGVERELGGESLTLRTLEHFASRFPTVRLRLLVGGDVLADLHKWHRWDRVSALAPPIVLGRVGHPAPARADGSPAALEAPEPLLPRISSTEIRDDLARGNGPALSHVVPASVLAYIEAGGLYRQR